MSKYTSLSEFISFNSEFRNAINLYLNLNNRAKILSYIPTKSSINILKRFMSGVQNNTLHTSMLIGPYGKGKTHLLLVLLAILSMDRNQEEAQEIYQALKKKVRKVDEEAAVLMDAIWEHKHGRFLPVVVNCQGDVNQAFLLGINDALNRNGLSELTPKTYYECAVDVINSWEEAYKDTFELFSVALKAKKISVSKMKTELLQYKEEYLRIFKEIYPTLTAGSVFNPLVEMDVTRLYSSIADKLREEYGYRGIYIVFDEFSKFIEGQDKTASGLNMKLVQDICEMAGDAKDPQIHITLVAHKPIKEYGNLLRPETINSFTGIEGRLDDEIYFKSSAKNNYELIQNAIIKDNDALKALPETVFERYFSAEYIGESYSVPGYSSEFTSEDFSKIVAYGCYPLTPTTAYLLLNISERVAQNERTLFTFISKDEQKSVVEFVRRSGDAYGWVITPDMVYDYFTNLFKNESDEIKSIYQKSVVAIDMASQRFGADALHIQIIKTLAVLMIVNKKQEMAWDKFTLRLAVDMNLSHEREEKFEQTMRELCEAAILDVDGDNLYRFKTIEGTELEEEIGKRWKLVVNEKTLGDLLQKAYEVKYVFPKRYNYEYGMTRYFRTDYISVENFLKFQSEQILFQDGLFCDGKVVLLYQYDDNDYTEELKKQIKRLKSRKLVVVYAKRSLEIREIVEKLQVIKNIRNDHYFIDKNPKLLPELIALEEDIAEKIKVTLEDIYGRFGVYEILSYAEAEIKGATINSIGEAVDLLCYELYSETPVINNEFINKQYITTGATKTARKNIMDRLLHRKSVDDYLCGTSQDATIYRSMFVTNGVVTDNPEQRIYKVLEHIEEYIEKCSGEKQRVSDLLNVICSNPYAIRLGVIPIYLAYVIGKRNVDTVVYYGDKEIPLSADTLINMCEYPDEYSLYISKEDEAREQYIQSLCELFNIRYSEDVAEVRIKLILEGLQKWYRALPQVTKNLKGNQDYFGTIEYQKAIKRVSNILQRYEVNSYEAVFKQLPEAFDSADDLKQCIEKLAIFKTKLSGYFQWIVNRAAEETKRIFAVNDDSLYHGLIEWYDCQSEKAKGEISEQKTAALMNVIVALLKINATNSFDDGDITQKIVKAVMGVYIDYWNDLSLEQYVLELSELKNKIESFRDEEGSTEKLVYTSRAGKQIYYEASTGEDTELFKDILSGTISDFEGLGKNDLIAILLDEVERIIAKEE